MQQGAGVIVNTGITDPYESNILLLYGFDNVPPTNSLGYVYDDSGNGLIAKPSNLSAYTTPGGFPAISTNNGVVNYGLSLNSYDLKCVQTSLWASVVHPTVTSAYTMSMWNFNKSSPIVPPFNMTWVDVGGNSKKMYAVDTLNVVLGSLTNGVWDAIVNTTIPITGTWHNFTICFSNNNFKGYIDGIQKISDVSVSACPTGSLNHLSFYPNATSGSGGSIGDRAVLYSRFLSSQEVVNLVLNTHPTNRIWRK
jgi:hypothetical protein